MKRPLGLIASLRRANALGTTDLIEERVYSDKDVRGVLEAPWGEWPGYLRPSQRDAAFTLLQAIKKNGARMTLDASDTGLGKTWTALEVVKQLGINFGVVCPSNVVTKWTDTAISKPFELEPEFVLSYEKLRGGKTDYLTRTDIIYRKKKRSSFSWNTIDKVALIFDEVHMCAGDGSLNSKMLKAAIDNPHVLTMGLSATCSSSPLSMEVLGYGLCMHEFDDFFKWCVKRGCRAGPFGGLIFDTGVSEREPSEKQAKARNQLLNIHSHIFPRRGCRLRKSEIKEAMATNTVMAECVDVDWKHAKIQPALKAVAKLEEEDEEKALAKDNAVSSLTLNTRARQRTEILKVPVLADRAQQLLDEGNSVILFVSFHETIALLEEMLAKTPMVKVVGGMGSKMGLAISKFQRNEVRLVICQTEAGSASIDLDDTDGRYPRCSIISPTYSARQLLQAIGRPHRGPTTKSSVYQWILFAAGTVEERACRIVQQKLNNLALLNDGDLMGVTKVI